MAEWKETEIGAIPSDWDVGVFDEDLTVKGRIGWMGYTTSDLVEIGPLVIGGTEIKSRIFLDLQNAQHLRRQKYEESPDIQLKAGDVLLVTRGNLGAVGYFHSEYGEATINPSVIILKNFKGDSRFLFYYLVSKQGQNNVLSLSSGSSVPAIYQAHVKELKYPKPNLEEQKKIADFCYAIDSKIDLLHRQNKTLEALAETLFRQWFVPAHRNGSEGREEAEENWEKGKLGDAITVKGGTTPSTKQPEYWNGTIHWTSPRDLSNHNSIFMLDTEKKITEKGLAEIGSGLLPIGSVLLSSRAPIGYTAIIDIPVAINQGYIGIICDKLWSNYFVYLWVKFNLDTIAGSAHGSVFPEIPKSTFKELDVTLPPKQRLVDFDVQVQPLFEKVKSNVYQIRTLTQLRDTLLPKLMSGEIRVNSEE
jgi:type I restriction enzyme S subunit